MLLTLFFVHEGIIRFAYKYLFQTGFIVAAGLLKKIELEEHELWFLISASGSLQSVHEVTCSTNPKFLLSSMHDVSGYDLYTMPQIISRVHVIALSVETTKHCTWLN